MFSRDRMGCGKRSGSFDDCKKLVVVCLLGPHVLSGTLL
jgi:hypothetical protein